MRQYPGIGRVGDTLNLPGPITTGYMEPFAVGIVCPALPLGIRVGGGRRHSGKRALEYGSEIVAYSCFKL